MTVHDALRLKGIAGAVATPTQEPAKCHSIPSKDAITPFGKPADNRPGQNSREPTEAHCPIGFPNGLQGA